MPRGSCTRCGTPDATAELFGGVCAWCRRQSQRFTLLLVLVLLILAGIAAGVDLVVNYWLYGDPWCAIKTCIEMK